MLANPTVFVLHEKGFFVGMPKCPCGLCHTIQMLGVGIKFRFTAHDRGGPTLLDCHSAQVVRPYQLGLASTGLGTCFGQLEGPKGFQSTSLP